MLAPLGLVSCSLRSVLITALDLAHVHAAPANRALFIPLVFLFASNSLWSHPTVSEAKKIDLRKKEAAVCGRRIHVGKAKCRDQDRAERARCSQHAQLRGRFMEPAPKVSESKKMDLRKKDGAVGNCGNSDVETCSQIVWVTVAISKYGNERKTE